MLASHAWGILRLVWGVQKQQSVKCFVWCVIALWPLGPHFGPALLVTGKQKNFDLHFLDSPGDNSPDFKYPLAPNFPSSFIHIHIQLSECVLPANPSKPMAPTATPTAQMVLPTATTMATPASRHATTPVLTM
jgi:hypothetical protein